MNRTRLLLWMILLFFGALFWLRANVLLDPDFGWHLRMGQIIISHGIPATDPFSYTMSHYPLVDHEWLSNVFLALLYPRISFLGVAGIFSLITLLAVYIRVKNVSVASGWSVAIPLLLGMITLLDSVSVRVQIIDLLFLAVLSEILFDKALYQKWRFVLPLLFLLWSNLHGGFVLGIGVYGIFIAFHLLQKKTHAFSDLLIFACSIGCTLLSPYHMRLWEEVFRNIATIGVYTNVEEWLPTFLFPNFLAFWIYFPLSVIVVIRNKLFSSLGEGFVFCFLAFLSISSLRNVPLFIIFSLPLTIRAFDALAKKSSMYANGTKILLISIFFLLGFFQVRRDMQLAFVSSEDAVYPKQAITYLKNHPFEGNLFIPYVWGGYMVWKYPEKKIYVNGMMTVWENNIFPGESKNALQDYVAILDRKRFFGKDIKQYDINTVLLPISNTSPLSAADIQSLKMHLVYKDTISEIYRIK